MDDRLAAHVAAYWTLVVEQPPARMRVVPDGRVDLVFDLDLAEAHVGGTLQEPFDAVHERPTHLLGVTLLPGTAAPLLGIPIGALSADWQPLAGLVGPAAGVLASRLRAAPSLASRLALIETFLLARLGRTDARVETAVRTIHEQSGSLEIEDLGRQSGASPRNLSRLFHEWVGLSPKKLARIVRAQAALRRLAEPSPPDLAALAAELGFSDQAHLTREIRALAGAAPSQLAATFRRTSDSFDR